MILPSRGSREVVRPIVEGDVFVGGSLSLTATHCTAKPMDAHRPVGGARHRRLSVVDATAGKGPTLLRPAVAFRLNCA